MAVEHGTLETTGERGRKHRRESARGRGRSVLGRDENRISGTGWERGPIPRSVFGRGESSEACLTLDQRDDGGGKGC